MAVPCSVICMQEKYNANSVKDYKLKSLDLVEILYSDAVTKAVLSVWELLLEWWLDSNSNVTMELRQKMGRLINQ